MNNNVVYIHAQEFVWKMFYFLLTRCIGKEISDCSLPRTVFILFRKTHTLSPKWLFLCMSPHGLCMFLVPDAIRFPKYHHSYLCMILFQWYIVCFPNNSWFVVFFAVFINFSYSYILNAYFFYNNIKTIKSRENSIYKCIQKQTPGSKLHKEV